jgi:hypothetical protein
MKPRNHKTDAELTLTVERAKSRARRSDHWERDLWTAYVLDGPGRPRPAANEPPPDIA